LEHSKKGWFRRVNVKLVSMKYKVLRQWEGDVEVTVCIIKDSGDAKQLKHI
jgi:hypothetical protein